MAKAGRGRSQAQQSDAQREEDPRERILAAAQRVFLEQGFELATVREITLRAEVNVSAINYYFGSKDELLGAVLDRIMQPYTEARVSALEGAEREAGGNGPSLTQIVEALIRPMVELSRDATGARPLTRLIQQIRARPNEGTSRFFTQRVDPSVFQFINAFQRALPHLDRADLFWRYNFAIGAVMQVLIDSDPATFRLKRLSGDLCDTSDEDEIIAQLVAFVSAGFRAPSAIKARSEAI
ncbi:TetR family transcriptional regulator [Aquabacter sp. L1I39]|uniref:TetR/AcrR family transcriptional regulator n=1 Tax=Aquabacter sp. L1I39 TaxID=2820278 RepID=UPI001ADBAC92|nr:TetR/AcrR family transcriptional regulator [Aquabacter sp. L1I39]QTL02059.1 TetR family transcriptional regulator [Aquabacter sp. L1I39]